MNVIGALSAVGVVSVLPEFARTLVFAVPVMSVVALVETLREIFAAGIVAAVATHVIVEIWSVV